MANRIPLYFSRAQVEMLERLATAYEQHLNKSTPDADVTKLAQQLRRVLRQQATTDRPQNNASA